MIKTGISLKEKLQDESNIFAHKAYKFTRSLPNHELYGLSSQLRRAATSVPLNIIEGFARDDWNKSKKDLLRFMEISFGSLQESIYLIKFCQDEYSLQASLTKNSIEYANSLSALVFSFIKNLRKQVYS